MINPVCAHCGKNRIEDTNHWFAITQQKGRFFHVEKIWLKDGDQKNRRYACGITCLLNLLERLAFGLIGQKQYEK
jgi:hypothetical protein